MKFIIKFLGLPIILLLGLLFLFEFESLAVTPQKDVHQSCNSIEGCQQIIAKHERDKEKLFSALMLEKEKNKLAAGKNDAVWDGYRKALISEYDRSIQFHKIQIDAFREQALHGNYSLIIISILMAAGLLFAGFQLYFSVVFGRKVEKAEDSLTMGNLSLKSSAMGVTVLFVWLAAYFIYVDKIYPIDVIDVQNKIQQKAKTEN